jgi:hypothetical protein
MGPLHQHDYDDDAIADVDALNFPLSKNTVYLV